MKCCRLSAEAANKLRIKYRVWLFQYRVGLWSIAFFEIFGTDCAAVMFDLLKNRKALFKFNTKNFKRLGLSCVHHQRKIYYKKTNSG